MIVIGMFSVQAKFVAPGCAMADGAVDPSIASVFFG